MGVPGVAQHLKGCDKTKIIGEDQTENVLYASEAPDAPLKVCDFRLSKSRYGGADLVAAAWLSRLKSLNPSSRALKALQASKMRGRVGYKVSAHHCVAHDDDGRQGQRKAA